MTGAGEHARGLDEFVAAARAGVERRLGELLSSPGEAPPRLIEAMRYALLGGGKRLRPLLVLASGELFRSPGGKLAGSEDLLSAACAVEMVHTFSLIHDDLPALDNDDMRRGRPSLHVQFDEATAILAGDALMNQAYDVLSRLRAPAGARVRAIRAVAAAVGTAGMIAGQVLDLESEGRPIDGATLHRLHRLKTGALFIACCELGGILGRGDRASVARLRGYGEKFGLAFQVVDDILDVEGSAAELGKSPGKDARAGKATFPALWGVEGSRARARQLVEEACAALEPFGAGAQPLAELARGMLSRRG